MEMWNGRMCRGSVNVNVSVYSVYRCIVNRVQIENAKQGYGFSVFAFWPKICSIPLDVSAPPPSLSSSP